MGEIKSNTKVGRKEIGIRIRKKKVLKNNKSVSPTMKSLEEQMFTLHKKIKKDDPTVVTKYSIEKDVNGMGYHVHLIYNYTDENNLNEKLLKFVGGTEWGIKSTMKRSEEAVGKYGEVYKHELYDDLGFLDYMNKFNASITLW